MKIKKIIDYVTQDYGIFGTYLIGSELETFGDLPTIPDGYMFYKVDCDEDIKNVKHIMKLENEEIDELYPNSENEIRIALDDYESRCFLAMLFLRMYLIIGVVSTLKLYMILKTIIILQPLIIYQWNYGIGFEMKFQQSN